MKKLMALLMTLCLLWTCAAAEVATLGNTGLTLDMGSMTSERMDAEDIADGMILYYVGDTMECAVYVDEGLGKGLSPEDLSGILEDEDGITVIGSGLVKVGGQEAWRVEMSVEGERYVLYLLIAGDDLVEVNFYCDDNAAVSAADAVMGTLRARGTVSVGYSYETAGSAQRIPGVGLSLDLTGMDMLDPEELDADDEDLVMAFCNDEETLVAYVWAWDADGDTLEDMEQAIAEEGGSMSCGYTTINGIRCLYNVYQEDGMTVVEYIMLDGGTMVQIAFVCDGDAATQQSGQIMNTLKK